jgi:hypothetical protein
MSKEVAAYAVGTGEYTESYEQAAAKAGISDEGIMLLSSFSDLLKRGEVDDDEIVTAREQLLKIADALENSGTKYDLEKLANSLRYLSQFTVDRPVPLADTF